MWHLSNRQLKELDRQAILQIVLPRPDPIHIDLEDWAEMECDFQDALIISATSTTVRVRSRSVGMDQTLPSIVTHHEPASDQDTTEMSVVWVRVSNWVTASRFKAGHRVRILQPQWPGGGAD